MMLMSVCWEVEGFVHTAEESFSEYLAESECYIFLDLQAGDMLCYVFSSLF